jgi:glycosyltransferase involved in cell wall biosynthesis
VNWTGVIPRSELTGIYQAHDTLIFPSVWEEPFSIALLEGMASGLAIVSTETGGTPEILADGDNALIFPREDAQACAQQIIKLQGNPELHERIRKSARQIVEQRFTFEQMMMKIENSFQRLH